MMRRPGFKSLCGVRDELLRARIEKTGGRHVDTEVELLAKLRRAIRIEAADHLAIADPQVCHRLGAGRLDQLYGRSEAGERRLLGLQLGIVAIEMFGTDAEH